MQIADIITEVDAEIARLQQAKALLTDTTVKRGPGRAAGSPKESTPKKNTHSPEGLARIAAAQKKRWANARKSKQLVNHSRSPGSPTSGRSAHEPFVLPRHPAAQESAAKRTISPEGRARIAAAQKARWARAKEAGK
jgi:hypothetical protein